MSAIFKSAAMTLLSKTLQTLLYKYLEDVDVEGVALPSISGSDGHSGWGVRLSNVKLRSGAILMELASVSRKRKKKKKSKVYKTTSVITMKDEVFGPQQAHNEEETEVTRKVEGEDDPSTTAATAADDVSEVTAPSAISAPDPGPHKPKPPEEPHKLHPPMAPKRSSSWFSGWYSSSKPPATKEKVKVAPRLEGSKFGSKTVEKKRGKPESPSQSLLDPPGAAPPSDPNDAVTEEPEKRTFETPHQPNENEKAADNDEDIEKLIPTILRLGENSRIGTLDVRLVGRDVHVLVEDADLTVEAVQVRPSPESEEWATPASGAASTGSATPKKPAPPPKEKPAPKTVAERIFAENPLARILSMIPNLLLRDIRLRLIVQDEPIDGEDEDTSDAKQHMNISRDNTGAADSVIELLIELLSITDGQDFFAHFRSSEHQDGSAMHREGDEADDDSSVDSQEEHRYYHTQSSSLPTDRSVMSAFDDEVPLLALPKNDYLTKRIRTGRGSDGGIVLRIIPGIYDDDWGRRGDARADDGVQWPRQRWKATVDDCVLLRCSGVDMQARIFVGSKTKVQFQGSSAWYTPGDVDDDDMLDEYSVDAMLFAGVDYIVPGPQPPSLPPISEENKPQQPITSESEVLWELPGATTYQLDSNGVQSSWVDTSFHRVARGLVPTICSNVHLPCEYCHDCWQERGWSSEPAEAKAEPHVLDAAAPLGGLVLQLSVRDILEINIDRPALDVIGIAMRLFDKPEPEAEKDNDESKFGASDPPQTVQANDELGDGSSHPKEPTTPAKEITVEPPAETNSPTELMQIQDHGQIKDAFPSYMQPEKIQYLGVHLTEVKLRLHIMRETNLSPDSGLCFSYWDAHAKCLTLDLQKLSGDVKQFQDVRFDVGHLEVSEYCGVDQKQVVSMGLKQRTVEFDEMTVETLMTREEDCQRPPWPSTAAVLLDIPPPLETLVYETRERHAIQLRFVSVGLPSLVEGTAGRVQSMVHVKLGASSAVIPPNIAGTAQIAIQEAKGCIMATSSEAQKPKSQSSISQHCQADNLMRYKVDLDGARIHLDPFLNVRLPLSTLTGELSSTAGFSIETILEHVSLQFGKKEKSSMLIGKRLSLPALAELPEPLRLRILFFLDDLNPLAIALSVKEASPLMLHKAITRQIEKLAKKSTRITRGLPTVSYAPCSGESSLGNANNRRQVILAELLKLDDVSLEGLWETHMRQERRRSKSKTRLQTGPG